MNIIKKLLLLVLAAPVVAMANEGLHLDKAPVNLNDKASLQRGAKTFVNYCLSCHSASYMRYNRLQDIGLTNDQIKDNLMFAADKVGETMTVAMRSKEAKVWFGAVPPDLTVIARSRGADYLYTYLRGFYRDDTRPTGWNNTVFDKVGMPHVLFGQQGEQVLHVEKHGEHETSKLVLAKPGTMTAPEYDAMVADLVNYLVYMGEPAQQTRMRLGVFVLLFLGFFFVVAYYLKKEFWKDVH
ncbi:MAG: cytochrome c1 [Sulfuricella sp.]|jgi:ubiquinol-cytochrome c reductase cytochrome c1 subunit|nr:cytochrome c1 [Sulfuricella sp.]